MIPIPLLDGQTLGQTVLTLVVAILPALLAWWNDRRLLGKGDDPALPELLANRRRFNVRAIATALGGHCRTLRRLEVGPFSVDEADPERMIDTDEALSRLPERVAG